MEPGLAYSLEEWSYLPGVCRNAVLSPAYLQPGDVHPRCGHQGVIFGLHGWAVWKRYFRNDDVMVGKNKWVRKLAYYLNKSLRGFQV